MLAWLQTTHERLTKSKIAQAILFFADALGKLAVFLAILFWFAECDNRDREYEYHAWAIINGARGSLDDAGRSVALDALVRDHAPLTSLDVTNINISNKPLRSALMSGTIFRHNRLEAVDFSCDWGFRGYAPFFSLCWGTQLDEAQFQTKSIFRLTFTNANLDRATFAAAPASALDRISAILSRSNFDNASMHGAIFRNIELADSTFEGTKMQKVRWEATTIRGGSFIGADFTDSKWYDVSFEFGQKNSYPNFTDAILSEVKVRRRVVPGIEQGVAVEHTLSEATDAELLKNVILCRTHFSGNSISKRDCQTQSKLEPSIRIGTTILASALEYEGVIWPTY